MPPLGPRDPLARRPTRIVVAGTSGAGKTTLARRISAAAGVPHTEIDALFHGPDWTPRTSFLEDVERLVAAPAWVTEWQYDAARPRLVAGADTVVWLDFPRALVMRRLVRRTLRRRFRRELLWNGNREPPLHTLLTDDQLLRPAWDSHPQLARELAEAVGPYPQLAVVRLRHPREVEAWLAGPLADATRPVG